MSAMSGLSVEEARAALKSHFKDYQGEKYGEGWDKLWSNGNLLPWDRLAPSPALVEVLATRHDVIGKAIIEVDGKPQRKKALVPGCGRGVDVMLLESFGYDAVGLEISKTAVEAAVKYGEENAEQFPVRDEQIGKGTKKFVYGDFYKSDWLKSAGMEGQKFDLIYDYTFFCAMNPSMRPAWSKRMSELLGPSPRANLICLEFPKLKPVGTSGPPFASPSAAYMEHLSHPGEDVVYDAEGNIKANPLVPASPGGLERVAHYTPADTHKVGKNEKGEVTDSIAIWRQR